MRVKFPVSIRPALLALLMLWLTATACALGGSPSTPTPGLTFVTITPSPAPAPTVPQPTTTPAPPSEDLSPHRAAMRPAFADDVNRQAEKGITRYQIRATVIPVQAENIAVEINGTLNAQFTNTEVVLLNRVYFRLLPNTPSYGGSLKVSAATINGQAAEMALLANDTTLAITLPRTLAPGEGVNIGLEFSATAPPTTRFGYGLFGVEDGITALANFFPMLTVFDATGWHIEVLPPYGDATYTDIALFDVQLTVPANMTVVTSGETLSDTLQPNGKRLVHAVTGPMRDFFMAMSPDFTQVQTQVDDITVTAFYLSGNDAGGQWMLNVSAQALAIFNRLFGEYPYRSFDVVAVPLPSELGGMEFPGVIAIAERYYAQPGQLEEFVTAHEVSHQWWYGLVGNDQPNEPWLDEALAQYSAVLYFEQTYGAGTHQSLVDTNFHFPYNQLLAYGMDRPAADPVNRFSELEYTWVVYGKAPLFFEAIRQQVGDPSFFAGLRDYAMVYRYGIVKPTDLLDRFEQASGQDLEWIYRQWIGELP